MQGLRFLPDYITKPYIEKGALCYLNVPEMEIEIWTQLLHHTGKMGFRADADCD